MLIKRTILDALKKHLDRPEITIITGARQVGKTTLMKALQAHLHETGKPSLYFNLDFESDFRYLDSQESFLRKLSLEAGNEFTWVFIDEIQRKKNAGLFLKGLYDMQLPFKFIVSGSGSLELKENIHESLTGRKRLFELMPVTFTEFINYKTDYRYEDRLLEFFNTELDKTEIYLNEYLAWGGYPGIMTEHRGEDKNQLMNEIFSSYIQKDLSYLLNLDRPDAFVKLIEWLSHSVGTSINYSRISNDIGLSLPVVKKYLWYAEQTFIIKLITPFFRSRRKEIVRAPAAYFCDTGMLNFAAGRYGIFPKTLGSGTGFENFIFTLLYEKAMQSSHFVNYWRTADMAEVDFVITGRNKILPVEVKYSKIKRPKISRSFRSFISEYEPDKAYLVNLLYRGELKAGNTRIKIVPFHDLFFMGL